MPRKHITRIMEVMDNIVSLDPRKRKYSDHQILKLLVLLQIFSISYRAARIFLTNHEEYLGMTGLKELPSFQTLSRRARLLDLHAINREINFLHSMESIAAVDSFKIQTRKFSNAARRKSLGNESGCSKTTKGCSYGMKCHMTLDVDSLLIMEWLITSGNIHDSRVSHEMVDLVRSFSYILADSAYDTSDTYDYVFENRHTLPVIDPDRRRGIVPERLSVNRKIGIDLRREYASLYSLR